MNTETKPAELPQEPLPNKTTSLTFKLLMLSFVLLMVFVWVIGCRIYQTADDIAYIKSIGGELKCERWLSWDNKYFAWLESKLPEYVFGTPKRLSFARTKISERDYAIINRYKSLDNCYFNKCTFTPTNIHLFANPKNIIYLSFEYCDLSNLKLEQIARLTNLESLCFACCQLTDQQLSCCRKLNKLTGLFLYDNQITDAGLHILEDLTQIEGLYLSKNKINGSGLKYLHRMSKLTTLTLANQPISLSNIDKLPLTKLTNLKFLEVGVSDLDDQSLDAICVIKTLVSLDISSNQLTNEGLKSLKNLPVLDRLNISYNPEIDDKAIPYLADIHKLKTLDTDKTKISYQGLRELGKTLPDAWCGKEQKLLSEIGE